MLQIKFRGVGHRPRPGSVPEQLRNFPDTPADTLFQGPCQQISGKGNTFLKSYGVVQVGPPFGSTVEADTAVVIADRSQAAEAVFNKAVRFKIQDGFFQRDRAEADSAYRAYAIGICLHTVTDTPGPDTEQSSKAPVVGKEGKDPAAGKVQGCFDPESVTSTS